MRASFGSATYSPDNLLASDAPIASRKVTLITGQNVTRGTVLGKITASGKYNRSLSAAADGSQTPDAIAAEDVDATAADKEILVYVRGDFAESALTLGAAHTVASIREGLRAMGITLVAIQGA
ncbi:MAG: head decoration protein [Gemmatimonadaceae bacterium]|nr:head decoration protein [Gemmatimonadaceae bacterium]